MTTPDTETQQRLNQAVRDHQGDTEAWTRLGGRLLVRRQLLGYGNRRQFIRERGEPRGVNEKLIYDLEGGPRWGRKGFRADTLRAAAGAYAVTAGSIADVLDGGELEPLPEETRPALRALPPVDPSNPVPLLGQVDPEDRERLAKKVREIQGRVIFARDKQPSGKLAGRLVFPGDPVMSQAWDRLAESGNPFVQTDDEMVQTIADGWLTHVAPHEDRESPGARGRT